MIDSDDVLLLRPARPGSAFALDARMRRDVGSAAGVVEPTIVYVDAAADVAALLVILDEKITPAVQEEGGSILAYFSEASENTFPRLPVREDENVFVIAAGYPDGVEPEDQRRAWNGMARNPCRSRYVRLRFSASHHVAVTARWSCTSCGACAASPRPTPAERVPPPHPQLSEPTINRGAAGARALGLACGSG